MIFYLGAGSCPWLATAGVPLFMSHRSMWKRKTLPRAIAPWALDSGGFSELTIYGHWETTPEAYVEACRRYVDEVGAPVFAAPQDWMCDPDMTTRTGLSVIEHQERTVESYLLLRDMAPDIPFIPVLQGWEPASYLAHAELYAAAGVDLDAEATVGVGTIARRQHRTAVEIIVTNLHGMTNLHGFGVKGGGFRRYGYLLASSDSTAWAYSGMLRHPNLHPDCTKSSCAGCIEYALAWRRRILGKLDYQQTHLGLEAS